MSDIERFYEAIRKHFDGSPSWDELHPMQQMQVVQAVNMILGVVVR